MPKAPYAFPYQGSKRKLADTILMHVPQQIERLVEPFAGSAAVSLAALHRMQVKRIVLNDSNAALIALWQCVLDDPTGLADEYERL